MVKSFETSVQAYFNQVSHKIYGLKFNVCFSKSVRTIPTSVKDYIVFVAQFNKLYYPYAY